MNKSAAFKAGVLNALELSLQDDLEKEAGILSVLSKGRAAVNKGGASAFGSLGKRLGGGRLGQAADVVAHQGRQQASKSKLVARGLDQGAARLAKAKATGKEVAEAVSGKIQGAKNPAQRMAMRKEVADTQKRLVSKARPVVPTKPLPAALPAPAPAQKSFLRRPGAMLGAGLAVGTAAGAAGSHMTSRRSEQGYGGMA